MLLDESAAKEAERLAEAHAKAAEEEAEHEQQTNSAQANRAAETKPASPVKVYLCSILAFVHVATACRQDPNVTFVTCECRIRHPGCTRRELIEAKTECHPRQSGTLTEIALRPHRQNQKHNPVRSTAEQPPCNRSSKEC